MIYSLYIFDRHCECVYYQDWHRTSPVRLPTPANAKPAVHRLSPSAVPTSITAPNPSTARQSLPSASVRESIFSSASVSAVLGNRHSLQSIARSDEAFNAGTPEASGANSSNRHSRISGSGGAGLPFDEEAKLVYGVVLSLRNMVKKLSGREEAFTSYRTPTYKFHLFETPTNYRFVLLSDPSSDSLRFVLRQIYTGPFVDYVVRNPLLQMDDRTQGIDNEQFRAAVDRHIRALSMYNA